MLTFCRSTRNAADRSVNTTLRRSVHAAMAFVAVIQKDRVAWCAAERFVGNATLRKRDGAAALGVLAFFVPSGSVFHSQQCTVRVAESIALAVSQALVVQCVRWII